MDPYEACRSCACYIKRFEVRCPFCGAPHTWSARGATTPSRMSRARWLALGSSLVVAGCGGASDPTSSGRSGEQGSTDGAVDTGQPSAQGGDSGASGDAEQVSDSSQTVLADAAEASSCTVSTAPFACGTQTCDPSSQFCQMYSWGGGACVADDAGSFFPPQCYDCPTCTCVAPTLWANCHCLDLDGGGIGIECAGCYGSPPTRLELLEA